MSDSWQGTGLTFELEGQLQHLATSQGKNAAQVIEEAVTRMLERQASFIEGNHPGGRRKPPAN